MFRGSIALEARTRGARFAPSEGGSLASIMTWVFGAGRHDGAHRPRDLQGVSEWISWPMFRGSATVTSEAMSWLSLAGRRRQGAGDVRI